MFSKLPFFLSTPLWFYFVFSSAFCMESLQEEATASPGYTVVFKKEDFSPLPEDPWKPLPITKLPDDFKRMLRKKNGVKKDGVEAFFLKLEMKDEKSNPTLQRTDDYIYDPSIRIGSGDGGVVYLGRHSPSQRYVALKAVKAFNSNPEEQEDYCGWKQAGRLFACYKKPMGSYSTFLLYIPLVIGETLAEIQDSREFMKNLGIENKGSGKIKEISYSQWEINQRLLQSFVEEYKFCKKKGAMQDTDSSNFLLTSDLQKIVYIDLEACISTKKDSIRGNDLIYLQKLLGYPAYYYVPSYNYKEGAIVLPPPVWEFNQKIAARRVKNKSMSIKEVETLLNNLDKGMIRLQASEKKHN